MKSNTHFVPQIMISQNEFSHLLAEYLQHRQIIMESGKQEHNFLFVSNSNNSKGKPIGGGTIYSKYKQITKNELDTFSKYSPHTFRHYFATYMIRIRKELLADVSEWLGHRDEKTTKTIYLHYLPNKEDLDSKNGTTEVITTFKGMTT